MRLSKAAAFPFLVLLVGLSISLGLGYQLERAAEARMRLRFDALTAESIAAIESKMSVQFDMLRGLTGLFDSSEFVTADEFAAYSATLDLPRNYPGVIGVGYQVNIDDPANIPAVIAKYGALNRVPGFHYWPEGRRARHSSIVYVEPRTPAALLGLGFDGFSEVNRASGMYKAESSHKPAISGKIRLFSGADDRRRAGLLIYMPHYAKSGPDKGKIMGWLFSAVRADDLFSGLTESEEDSDINVSIYAGTPSPATLIFSPKRAASKPSLKTSRKIRVEGDSWTIVLESTPKFDSSVAHDLPLTVTIGGILFSLLLAYTIMRQQRSVVMVEQLVAQRTAELQESNDLLRAESSSREIAEQQLRQLQKMEAIGQLTGGIAHDFNNMLAVIIGSLDLARQRIDGDPAKLTRLIDHAMEGARHAAALTQRLLAFARRQTLTPELIAPDRLVSSMSDLLRRSLGENVRLEVIADSGTWTVSADPTQLESALLNLAINARDAMPRGGELVIQTGNQVLDAAYCRATPDATPGEYVMISVSDNGVGMPPEVLEKAVDPFFSTKDVGKGSGLGLSQVFGFVRQSGGHMRLFSEPGFGTTVEIYLPRSTPAPAAAGEDTSPTSPVADAPFPIGTPDELVLLVEDEAKVRLMTVEALRDLGYTVLHAPNGDEALRLLEITPNVKLLFTDIMMPCMNGRELAEIALRRWPHLKLLYATGYTPDAIMAEGMVEPGVILLSKPFTIAKLAAKVRAAIDA